MKIPAAIFGLVLEATFIVYCIYLICLLDMADPFPREWMIPNTVIGLAVLSFGYVFASGRQRNFTAPLDREKWPEQSHRPTNFTRH
jgi:hypothetical protein